MARRTTSSFHLGRVFDWHAEQARQSVLHVDRPFDIAPDGGLVYDGPALAAAVRELSDCLHAAGLRRGDRVVVSKENHFDMVLLAAGAARIGAVPVMIAPIASLESVRTMVDRAAPRLLVAGTGLLARAAEAGVELADEAVRVVRAGPSGAGGGGAVPLDELRGGPAAPARPGGDDDPMIATHTSGTTGVPKLVLHTANTAVGRFPPRMERYRLPLLTTRRDDVVAAAVSFAHIRVVAWASSQLKMAPRKLVAVSDPGLATVERVLEEHRPTSLEAFPNVFQHWEQLVDERPELFARTRLYVSTFDAVHPRTVRKFLGASRRRFPVWGWGLGQSEITGIMANLFTRRTVRAKARPDATNTGWPMLVGLDVVDPETGRRQARGKPGIIMVSTRARCLTYLGEDDRYRAKLDGRWWNSGDLGVRAGFGRVRLIDREVDMVPGISCIELESTLLERLENASDVTVLGVPGQPPVPVLCMRGDRLDPREWERATAGLPALAPPRTVPWEDVPRTATWKVRRAALREQVLGTGATFGSGKWT
ncbi:AMP-binding protein [Streptomyces roseolilacinus]|uniref:Fatty-acid-CoA ligase FadD n=1 Tax=Streptomyces roseolilacinus TaxID=66904 RepID=A0A918EKD9_9ACTN|nr:class I adenylate-forming enzyme family protein [Streptomyces roseolilacinus]GGQ13979.1 putative fatty-acid-CoA ligase FadD [Streptomyces roseolilacinus]